MFSRCAMAHGVLCLAARDACLACVGTAVRSSLLTRASHNPLWTFWRTRSASRSCWTSSWCVWPLCRRRRECSALVLLIATTVACHAGLSS
jgi:hypothetical protein